MWSLFDINNNLNRYMARVLAQGPVPQHVAFCMDGNRRFARKYGLEMGAGHFAGFESLLRLLSAAQWLGIKSVTAYAFSIENFNRPRHESDLLFDMVRTQLWELVNDRDREGVAQQMGWRILFLGNRSLIASDIQERMEEIERRTAHNGTLIVNICCPYTSRDDIAQAMSSFSQRSDDADGEFSKRLYTHHSGPLDLLVRTSGETRLSDFMCWEVVNSSCDVVFTEALWPSFSVLNFYYIILEWSFRRAICPSPAQYGKLDPAPPLVSVSDRKAVKRTVTDATK